MSDQFQRALNETLPLLKKIHSGLKPPPPASRSALQVLRKSTLQAIPQPAISAAAPAPNAVTATHSAQSRQSGAGIPPAFKKEGSRNGRPTSETRVGLVPFASLRTTVLACKKCPHLVASRTQVVFGVGNPDADLMFVGEAPGADEDEQGEPFVGRAGQLLTKIIQAMGFERSDVYIANVLKCRPNMPVGESGNRKPKPAEMETCLPWLKEQIHIVKPRAIVALGATAVEGLVGDTSPMRDLRGRWLEFEGIPLMVTYHPAYLLRNQSISEKRKVWEDMLLVLEKLGHKISAKQRRFFTADA